VTPVTRARGAGQLVSVHDATARGLRALSAVPPRFLWCSRSVRRSCSCRSCGPIPKPASWT